jgi:probable rRNA maturation factor
MRTSNRQSMIINSQQRVRVSEAPLKRFLGEVQTMLRIPEGAVTVCLVPGERIARWNRMYRGKAKATDVLSFPAGENGVDEDTFEEKDGVSSRIGDRGAHPVHLSLAPVGARRMGHPGTLLKQLRNPAEGAYLGDIAICPAVAQRNARSSNRALGAELRILILHGILHLLGYDHETDTGQMERRERKLRRRLGLA